MGDEWLIWSNQHNAWSAPDRRGHTGMVENAGRYTRADADQICAAASQDGTITVDRQDPDGQVRQVPPETAVKAPKADLVSDLPLLAALALGDLATVENPFLRAALQRIAAQNEKKDDALAGFNSAF